MNNTEFSKLSVQDKIDTIISDVKKSLMSGKNIISTFYLFDENSKLHALEIDDQFLLEEEKSDILVEIVKEKIRDLKSKKKLDVEKVLFLREGFYNPNHPNKNKMNLDSDFNKTNSNEALIVTVEDMFDFTIKVFDCITAVVDGENFKVISGKPIDTFEFCKIDPEYQVRTDYINLIE